jgi:hypothetical protein
MPRRETREEPSAKWNAAVVDVKERGKSDTSSTSKKQ